jgi:hypothetical protein
MVAIIGPPPDAASAATMDAGAPTTGTAGSVSFACG